MVQSIPPVTFITHAGLPPEYSHTCQTPWSVFLDGSVAPGQSAGASKAPKRGAHRSPAPRAIATRQQRLTRNTEVHRALQPKGPYGPRQARARLSRCHATAGAIGFPPANFKHSLTLFSKFFASFPHGTCSLSVSRQYLALDGIYHPIQAAIPSNPTLQGRIVRPRTATAQDSHLLRYPVPRDLSGGRGRWRLSRLQFGGSAEATSRLAA